MDGRREAAAVYWRTGDETKFLRESIRGKARSVAVRFLRGYLRAAVSRRDWGGVSPAKAIHCATSLLRNQAAA
jgi:hypothetical protein